MRKKLLILACVVMMLFGSVLTASAEETTDSSVTEETLYWVDLDNLVYNNPGTTWVKYTARFEYSSSLPVAGYIYKASETAYPSFRMLYKEKTGKNYVLFMPCISYEESENHNFSSVSYEVGTVYNSFPYTGTRESGLDSGKYNDYKLTTNMPIFSSVEECENYLDTGDLAGNLNDLTDTDKMEEDSTFAFTGFTAGSTGKTGHIKANWTGTTHDDKIDTYKEAKYTVYAGYAFTAQPGQIATVESNSFGGDIADKGFLKTYNSLKASDDTLFLRYLKVVPYYTIGDGLFGQSYKGKPCTIWLNEDGSIEKVVNDYDVEHGGGGNTDSQYDDTFYLTDVSVTQDLFDYLTGKRQYFVNWRGTSKEDIIDSLSPDSTNVFVQCIGENEFQEKKVFNYFSMDPFLNEIHIYERNGIFASMGNSFSFNLVSVESSMISEGYPFTGEVYLIPQYQTSGRERVRGCITSVNLFTGEVKIIKDKDPYEDTPADDDDGVVVTPPDDEDKNPDTGLPDIGGISDIPAYLLNLFNSFYSFVGALPNFLGVIFPFIPEQIRGLLGYGLLLVIVLRVLGR